MAYRNKHVIKGSGRKYRLLDENETIFSQQPNNGNADASTETETSNTLDQPREHDFNAPHFDNSNNNEPTEGSGTPHEANSLPKFVPSNAEAQSHSRTATDHDIFSHQSTLMPHEFGDKSSEQNAGKAKAPKHAGRHGGGLFAGFFVGMMLMIALVVRRRMKRSSLSKVGNDNSSMLLSTKIAAGMREGSLEIETDSLQKVPVDNVSDISDDDNDDSEFGEMA